VPVKTAKPTSLETNIPVFLSYMYRGKPPAPAEKCFRIYGVGGCGWVELLRATYT